MALTGCATRALSPEAPPNATAAAPLAAPPLAGSPAAPALVAPPLPPALEVLQPAAPSVPVGRTATVQPAIAAPCALPPEMRAPARAGSSTYDLPALYVQAIQRRDASTEHCPGGT